MADDNKDEYLCSVKEQQKYFSGSTLYCQIAYNGHGCASHPSCSAVLTSELR